MGRLQGAVESGAPRLQCRQHRIGRAGGHQRLEVRRAPYRSPSTPPSDASMRGIGLSRSCSEGAVEGLAKPRPTHLRRGTLHSKCMAHMQLKVLPLTPANYLAEPYSLGTPCGSQAEQYTTQHTSTRVVSTSMISSAHGHDNVKKKTIENWWLEPW
jgi:hypothetical protein